MNISLLDVAIDPFEEAFGGVDPGQILLLIGLVIGVQLVAGGIIAAIIVSKHKKRRQKENGDKPQA